MLDSLRIVDQKTKIKWLKWATHLVAWVPLLLLSGDGWYHHLGADPIREVTLRTGKWTLIFLLASLTMTPLNSFFSWKKLIPLRKLLGLYAFLYAFLHLLTFVGLDYQFVWHLIITEMVSRNYTFIGLIAFLILLSLAASSNTWAQRKLRKNWKRLHRLVYLAAMLAIAHFLLLVKNAYTEPLLYGLLLLILLLMRVTPIRKCLLQLRRGYQTRSP